MKVFCARALSREVFRRNDRERSCSRTNPIAASVVLVFVAGLMTGCASAFTSHRSFETAQWQRIEEATRCLPANIQATEVKPLKDPIFTRGAVAFRRAGMDGGPFYEIEAGPVADYGGKRYDLRLLRIVSPSAHRVAGMAFLLELQFFFISADGEPLGVAVFARKGQARPALSGLFSHTSGEVILEDLLPSYGGHYLYSGPLPTFSSKAPPCRGLRWVVMRSAIDISPEDLDEYLRHWPAVSQDSATLPAKAIVESE